MLKKLPQVRLFRFDVDLGSEKAGIDDGSAGNIEYLLKRAGKCGMQIKVKSMNL